jgi:hypothetical protein
VRLWPWAKQRRVSETEEWSEDEEKTGKLLNEEITKQLEIQRQAGTAVDTKAGIVAAAALAGTQFLAAQKQLYVPLFVAALVALGVSIGLAYGSLRIRQFVLVPEPRGLYFEYRDEPSARVLFELAIAKVEAYEDNRVIHERKANLQNWSLWALGIAALFGAIAKLVGS